MHILKIQKKQNNLSVYIVRVQAWKTRISRHKDKQGLSQTNKDKARKFSSG